MSAPVAFFDAKMRSAAIPNASEIIVATCDNIVQLHNTGLVTLSGQVCLNVGANTDAVIVRIREDDLSGSYQQQYVLQGAGAFGLMSHLTATIDTVADRGNFVTVKYVLTVECNNATAPTAILGGHFYAATGMQFIPGAAES